MNSLPISQHISSKADAPKPNESRQENDDNSFSTVLASQLSNKQASEADTQHKKTIKTEKAKAEESNQDASSSLVSLLHQINTRDMANAQFADHIKGTSSTEVEADIDLTTIDSKAELKASNNANYQSAASDNKQSVSQQQLNDLNNHLPAASSDENSKDLLNEQIIEISSKLTNSDKPLVDKLANSATSFINIAQTATNNISPTTTSPTSSTTLSTPFQTPQWGGDFAQKVSWIHNQKIQSAELNLNPANLGPIKIKLEISSDQQASFIFSSPHQAVREAIENALPRLRESLAENGISLGNTNVNDQASQQQNTQLNSEQQNRRATTENNNSNNPISEQTTHNSTQTIRQHNGLLDTFA